MRIAVDTILSAAPGEMIVSGVADDGGRLIVLLAEPIYPALGDVLEVAGEEGVYQDEYGRRHRQIKADRADRVRTSGRLIGPWLRTLPGIGEDRSKRLLERFGPDLLDVLDDPARIPEVAEALAPGRPALGQRLAALTVARFVAMRSSESVAVMEAEFLQRLEQIGVSDRRAARLLYRLIGSADAWERLMLRPYAAAAVMPWQEADHLGLRLLASRGDVLSPESHEERLIGACDGAWRTILSAGHTAAPEAEFLLVLNRMGVDAPRALSLGLDARRVLRLPDGGLLRAPGGAYLERQVACEIARIRDAAVGRPTIPPVRQFEDARRPLTDEQRRTVTEILGRRLSLLQGGAGTGKTTTMRVLAAAHEARGGDVLLAALAGKAALRLSRSTGRLAYTIARLINGLERRRRLEEEGQPVPRDLPYLGPGTMLIVDEGSMVDLASWNRLLRLVPTGGAVVIVGDVAQLPPVGLGRVYHDLVEDGRFLSRLTRTLRQAGDSPIIAAATAVREGRVPAIPKYAGVAPGVYHLDVPSNGLQAALERVYNDLTRGAGASREEMLVLAALRASCGRFCAAMQDRRQAEGAQGVRLGPLAGWVAVGDPVIATRNRYEDGLANGQFGWITGLAPLTVHFDGEDEPREVPPEVAWDLQSAWAITGHRAQGSEARRVVVALEPGALLTREWLYTALTRGTETVILVGPRDILAASVGRRSERWTAFRAAVAAADAIIPA